MTDFEDNKHRLELIKMSRELLNEEYINRRAQDHNRWLAESDVMWKAKRVKLPYPPFAAYPTDEEIVAKATVLYNFVNTKPAVEPAPAPIDVIPTPVEIAATNKILSTPIAEPLQSPWDKYLTPEQEPTLNEPVADISVPQTPVEETQSTQSSLVQNLLPGWIRRNQSA